MITPQIQLRRRIIRLQDAPAETTIRPQNNFTPPNIIPPQNNSTSKTGTSSSSSDNTTSPSSSDNSSIPAGLCPEITVTEGGFPGVYPYAGTPLYGDSSLGIGFVLLSDVAQRRSLKGADGTSALNGLALPANVKEDVGQELEACTEGLWFMSENPTVVPPTYPLYMTFDCSADVLDVTEDWYRIDAADAQPSLASPQPVLECTGTAGSNQTIEGTDAGTDNSAVMSVGAGAGMLLTAFSAAFIAHTGGFFLW
eukprot:jgi/Undpi1/12653/HiC_scaffold_6.g02321.m1